MDKEKIKKFLSEIQMLKRVKHEGVRCAGVENPDSLGEHVVITSQIAYVLAKMEGADTERCVAMSLFHDNGEVRIGDRTWVQSRYINAKKAERVAEREHFSNLPKVIANEINQLMDEKNKRETKESIIAKDADKLELAIQAKIYVEQGYAGCEDWIKNIESLIKTDSAKEIFEAIRNEPDLTNIWWQGLKKNPNK